MNEREESDLFESDVRQVARVLWRDAFLGGAEKLDGRERDGVFETRDAVHIVEATRSRQKKYIEEKGKSLSQLIQSTRSQTPKSCQGWIITRDDPTDEQRAACKRFQHSVRLLSFEEFRGLLFNGSEYIRCREKYRLEAYMITRKTTFFLTKVNTFRCRC